LVYEVDKAAALRHGASMAEATETIEAIPEIRELKQDTLKKVREVMRNLVRLRQLTGAIEIVALGEFLREAGSQEQAVAAPDPRLKAALDRGRAVRQKLLEAEGGSISAEAAAKELGMSKVAVLKRYQNHKLVAWREEKQNAIRFPIWQFKNGKVLDGIEAVLDKLKEGSLDDFGRLLFFLSNSKFLGGKRPLDCLRSGEVHKVIVAAEGYAA
jgi:hypothetical protein